MSFSIGQLRRNQFKQNVYQDDTVIATKDDTTGLVIGNFPLGEVRDNGNKFVELGVVMYDPSSLEPQPAAYFLEGETYCLDYNQLKLGSSGTVAIKLMDDKGNEMTVKIKTFSDSISTHSEKLIFTPNRNYMYIVFQVQRTTSSLKDTDIKCTINTVAITHLKNILTQPVFNDIDTIQRMGIQGPENLVFSMNGADYKLGRSGIYEVEDVEIKKLCFYIQEEESNLYFSDRYQFFIMDYEYTPKEA